MSLMMSFYGHVLVSEEVIGLKAICSASFSVYKMCPRVYLLSHCLETVLVRIQGLL